MEIRRSYDRLISTMGFPILVRYWIRAQVTTPLMMDGIKHRYYGPWLLPSGWTQQSITPTTTYHSPYPTTTTTTTPPAAQHHHPLRRPRKRLSLVYWVKRDLSLNMQCLKCQMYEVRPQNPTGLRFSDPNMHHGGTHVPWCMPGSLMPAHAQNAILRIW